MSAATAWAYIMALLTGALALWGALCLLGPAARRLAPARRPGPPAHPPPSPPARPPPAGVTLHMLPCGCLYHYQRIRVDPCPPHARMTAERDEINRLDQQIRNMP